MKNFLKQRPPLHLLGFVVVNCGQLFYEKYRVELEKVPYFQSVYQRYTCNCRDQVIGVNWFSNKVRVVELLDFACYEDCDEEIRLKLED